MPELRADLILSGGRVIDPATGRDGVADVAIVAGKIIGVAPALPTTHAASVVSVAGKVVVPRLIDTHAHVYRSDPDDRTRLLVARRSSHRRRQPAAAATHPYGRVKAYAQDGGNRDAAY
ncbi:MAG TPA: hypothetical protein VGU20_17630 [Stellaceae bacterium]|nr:hypothetical protein [Stellaceae bacterium]